jgi:hypothetical protein
MATPKKPSPTSNMFNAEFLSKFTGGASTVANTPVPGNGFTALKPRASLTTPKDIAPSGLPAAVRPTKQIGVQKNLTVDPLKLGVSGSVPGAAVAKGVKWSALMNKAGSKLKEIGKGAGEAIDKNVQFLSNVANSVIGPSDPKNPVMMPTPRPIPKVNMDATRNKIESTERGIVAGADQRVDGNTASAIALGARAQSLSAMNQVAEQENNANVNVARANQQTELQSNYANTTALNKFQDDQVGTANTRKTQTLANLSNFSDKIITQRNNEADRELDLEKAKILGTKYVPNVKRTVEQRSGVKFGRKGGKLKSYM